MLVGARYYDAQVGGFITRDTDLDQQPYLYCEHDPINQVDPSGHDYTWWNPFSWDYRFDKNDWDQIANGVYKIGGDEQAIGAVLGIPSMVGSGPSSLYQNIPGMTKPVFEPTSPGFYEPICPNPAKPGGISCAIGAGAILGGFISQHIVAPFFHYVLGNGD